MSNIRIITAPRVFLLGRQEIDGAGLAAFLESEGVDRWETFVNP